MNNFDEQKSRSTNVIGKHVMSKLLSVSIVLLIGVLAWVSISTSCSNNKNKVDYIPANVQAVDLGLSVRWASCNLGAETPEDYGNYYAWGEVLPKQDYCWENYKYANGEYLYELTKYCNDARYGDNGFTDTKTTLDPKDDAAHVIWGGNWRIPTADEWDELIKHCTWTWTTGGYQVTSRLNSNSIFLPAAGICFQGSYYNEMDGSYISSSSYVDDMSMAQSLNFYQNGGYLLPNYRCRGLTIRPVCP